MGRLLNPLMELLSYKFTVGLFNVICRPLIHKMCYLHEQGCQNVIPDKNVITVYA